MRLVRRKPLSGRQVFWTALASSFSLMLLWSLATPLLAVPDEPSHIIRSAAVARGDFAGVPGAKHLFTEVQVPDYIATLNSRTCFAFNPTIPANCPDIPMKDPDELVTAITTSTLNTPVYYFLTGLPSLVTNSPVTVYLMRAVSALLSALMIAFAAVALRQLGRSSLALTTLAIAVTPVVLFLGGSVNPNGLEVTASLAVLACLLALGRTQGEDPVLHRQQLVMLVISTFMLVNTRSLALAWLLFAVVIAILFSPKSAIRRLFAKRATWIGFAATSLVVFAAVAWYLLPKGLVPNVEVAVGRSLPPIDAYAFVVGHWREYANGWIGIFGWLDVFAPPITFTIWASITSLVLAFALAYANWPQRIALVIIGATIVLLPAIAQASLISAWGWVWQGRYHLALFAMLVLAAGVAVDSSKRRLPRSGWVPLLTAGIIGLSLVGQLWAFVYVMRRYIVGIQFPLRTVLTDPQWLPPLGFVALSVLFGIALVFAGWVLWRAANASSIKPSSDQPSSPESSPDARVSVTSS